MMPVDARSMTGQAQPRVTHIIPCLLPSWQADLMAPEPIVDVIPSSALTMGSEDAVVLLAPTTPVASLEVMEAQPECVSGEDAADESSMPIADHIPTMPTVRREGRVHEAPTCLRPSSCYQRQALPR